MSYPWRDVMIRRVQQAFTLIELLVDPHNFSILMGMVLPAIQNVRESASRTQCKNNLKQIGLAFHNYHSDRGAFPPGFASRAATVDGPSLGAGWGWAAHLLPHLEQGSLYRQIDFSKDISDPVNALARV